MRFLLIDPHGDALDVGLRAKQCGHDVKHFIKDTPRTCHIGIGLVDVIREFRPWLEWADLIFMGDNLLYVKELDSFRSFRPAALIVGPTAETAAWELDRAKGFQICKKHGIRTPPYKEFSDYDSAIAYVKKRDSRLVSKPFGDADKALTYCASGPDPVADMIFMLEKWKKQQKLKGAFILQDFIEGIEMAADGWFGPHGFDLGWSESFEFKKLMSSNYGVNTGEMGTVIRFTKSSKLARQVLDPLGEELARESYCGYVSVNSIIDKNGQPWFLEFTMRPGYPTINIEAEVHSEDDPAARLYALASGTDCRSVLIDKVALGVVVALPSFPHSHSLAKEMDGLPIFGLTDRLWPHVHLCQARLEKGQIQTAGDYVLVATAASNTVSQARQAAYARVKQISIPGGMSVRDDIGERLSKQLPELQKHGYAVGMAY
jgi:phosphoribosylamine---glycine ligase